MVVTTLDTIKLTYSCRHTVVCQLSALKVGSARDADSRRGTRLWPVLTRTFDHSCAAAPAVTGVRSAGPGALPLERNPEDRVFQIQ